MVTTLRLLLHDINKPSKKAIKHLSLTSETSLQTTKMSIRKLITNQTIRSLTKSGNSITTHFHKIRSFSEIPTHPNNQLSNLFQRYGFSLSQLPDYFKKNGFLLHLSPNDVSIRLNSLNSLGLSESTVTRILESVPMIIMLDQSEITSKVEFFIGIGFHRKEIDRLVNLFPEILTFEVVYRLKPLFDEFVELGFCLNEVKREIFKDPLVLGMENGEISHCLEFLRSLKCRVAIKESIFRYGEFRAAHNAKLRVDFLRKNGLTYRDAFTVLWKEPRVMLYELEEIGKKIEFLHRMKFDVQCIVEVPEYLGVSFDKQIVPRFKVMEYLHLNNGLGDELSLRKLIKLSRLRFYNMYVKPYPECEKLYGRFNGAVKVQSRHPVGMWKLFRPLQYSDSREDVKNIKSYVESVP